ncbi:MAG: AGE family epimerase/isomerase [Pirellulales bacterium]
MMNVSDDTYLQSIRSQYRQSLWQDVVPFWLRYGLDHEYGGYLTALARDGSVIDMDKSIWFQGRGAWMFSVLAQSDDCSEELKEELTSAARSGIDFLQRHGADPSGKLMFTVTRDGKPLRSRRYVYSESFAAIAYAAAHRQTGEVAYRSAALACFETYLQVSFDPGAMLPKVDPSTRPTRGIGSWMIAIVTAQEIRRTLGDVVVKQRSMTEWIDVAIREIETYFLKPDLEVLMEVVGMDGSVLDHFDTRQLNPGHAIECAWFIMWEGKLRGDRRLIELGLTILRWMWKRGWDREYGGLLYFCDVKGYPVQEYWHDMKFWWPHCEAIIATLLAWQLTGETQYAEMHSLVHQWSFEHFPDREFGEWYGYLHRDGRVSVTLKGNMWKGPFHLPRMLMTCSQLCDELALERGFPL